VKKITHPSKSGFQRVIDFVGNASGSFVRTQTDRRDLPR
jgi:hypothetical protein